MGEQKQKRRAHAKILEAHPWCVFCGGLFPAVTIDHVPPRMMFKGKQRPKGLEFPSCLSCNAGTSHSELVASMMGRIYPDPIADDEAQESKRLFQAVSNNIPGLLEEMYIGTAGQKLARKNYPFISTNGGVLRANGPLMTKHMQMFGAKLGLALHFAAYKVPVPVTGSVHPIWYSNVQAFGGKIPQSLLDILPPPRTLMQGTKHVGDQFRYSWCLTDDRKLSLFYATFRQAFAVAAFTTVDQAAYSERPIGNFPAFVPGKLG